MYLAALHCHWPAASGPSVSAGFKSHRIKKTDLNRMPFPDLRDDEVEVVPRSERGAEPAAAVEASCSLPETSNWPLLAQPHLWVPQCYRCNTPLSQKHTWRASLPVSLSANPAPQLPSQGTTASYTGQAAFTFMKDTVPSSPRTTGTIGTQVCPRRLLNDPGTVTTPLPGYRV